MAPGASTAYARNIVALLAHLVARRGAGVDLTDEIQAGGRASPTTAPWSTRVWEVTQHDERRCCCST